MSYFIDSCRHACRRFVLVGALSTGLLPITHDSVASGASMTGMLRVQDGADGTAGDPATDGQEGQAGQPVNHQVQSTEDFVIWGNDGGDGGDGGTGIDGPDNDSIAQGGDGGNGGNASTLHVWNDPGQANLVRSNLVLHGGVGGEAGRGGASVGLPNGQGGNGGSVGAVSAELYVNRSFTLHADGGLGGDAYGFQNQAGTGADVQARVQWLDSPFQSVNRTNYLRQILTGGAGGFGRARAHGGHGGSVTVLPPSQPSHFVSSTPFFLYDVTGGRGGDSLGGNSGHGGDLVWHAPDLQLGGDGTPALSRFQFNWEGGAGGNSFLFHGRNGPAGQGGSVLMKQDHPGTIHVQGGQVEWRAEITGGNGGRSNDGGNGGNGGNIDFEYLGFDTTGLVAAADQSIYARIHLTTGAGGTSVTGNGGDGGNLNYADPTVSWNTQGSVDLYQSLTGGNGGRGVAGGNGGDVRLRISDDLLTNSQSASQNPGGKVSLAVNSFGGYAWDGGTGGSAEADVVEQSDGDIDVKTLALAGQSVDGGAGSAFSRSVAISNGDAEERYARAYARTGARVNQEGPSRFGTSALSYAGAHIQNGVFSDAQAIARGGYGTHSSGSARALALATAQGNNTSRAFSETVTLGVGPNATDYSRESWAESNSQSEAGHAVSSSNATAYGQQSIAAAYSDGYGNSFNATATAKTETTARFHRATIQTTSESLVESGLREYFGTASEAYYQRRSANGLPKVTATNETRLWVSSGMDSLENLGFYPVGGSFDLSDPTNDVFHVAELQFGDTNLQAQSNLEVVQEIQSWETDHSLSVFFYDVEFQEDANATLDFLMEVNGQVIVDESWNSLDLAVDYLDNFLFQFDDELIAGEMLTTRWQATFRNEAESSRFHLRMGVAGLAGSDGFATFTAVPEPGSGALLMGGMIFYLALRRRR